MSANATRNNPNSSSIPDKEEELLRNAATTNELQAQPPNKFILNTKKVSGNSLTGAEINSAKICNETAEPNKQNLSATVSNSNKNFSELNNIQTSKHFSEQLKDFSKKKEERDREIIEIQEMLNKMKSPQKSSERSSQDSQKDAKVEAFPREGEGNLAAIQKTVVEKNVDSKNGNKDIALYGRCQTELQLIKPVEPASSRLTRRDTARSSSTAVTHKPRSKSSQWPLSAKETKTIKKISYNPEEARRYMEMQRKQRKLGLYKDPYANSKIEKDEIKKRLEELKASTRKLVVKNIQRKEKCLVKNSTNKETECEIPINSNLLVQEQDKESIGGRKAASNDSQMAKVSKNSSRLQQNKKTWSVPDISHRSSLRPPTRYTNVSVTEFQLPKQQEGLSSSKNSTQRNKKERVDQRISHRSSQGLNNVLKPSAAPFLENHKRVGLLRKIENDKDFSLISHRSYNFDKENQNLEILTKQLMNLQESKTNKDNINCTTNKEFGEQQLYNMEKHKDKPALIEDLSKDKHLKISVSEDKEQALINSELIQKEVPKPNELPYWLTPSATQVYPYNFVMAVRRKLESIAQPMTTRSDVSDNQQNPSLESILRQKKRKSLESLNEKEIKKTKRKQEDIKLNDENSIKEPSAIKESIFNELNYWPKDIEIKEYVNEKNNTQENNKSVTILSADEAIYVRHLKHTKKPIKSMDFQDNKCNNKTKSFALKPYFKPLQKSLHSLSSDQEDYKQPILQYKLPVNSKSMESLNSEINSNFSSMSLPIPISNTLTEVSSLRTESRKTSANNFKQPPMQSEDEVASLSSQIFSSPEKKTFPKAQNDFEFAKPRPVSPLSLEKVDKLKIKRKQADKPAENDDQEMHFTQLLEDFNRSLSQVIQVNEQLKCTLDKSQQILTPHSSKKSSEVENYYSSDFEKSTTIKVSSKENDTLKQSLEKSNEHLKQRKLQICEIAEKIKPIMAQQRSENNKIYKIVSTDERKSAETAKAEEPKISQPKFSDEEQSSSSVTSQSNDDRLNKIEKLKETLKQTILESRKKRQDKEQHPENEMEKRNKNEAVTSTEFLKYDNKETLETEMKSSNNSSLIASGNEKMHCKEYELLSSNKEMVTKSFSKYQKQHKNDVNLKAPSAGNSSRPQTKHSNKLQDEVEVNKIGNSIYKSNEMQQRKIKAIQNLSHSNHNTYEENSTKVTAYSTYLNKDTSNIISCQQHKHKIKKKINTGQTESRSCTLSDVDSASRSTEEAKSKYVSIISKAETPTSFSIAEELQKPYESDSCDNENIVQDSKAITNSNESAQFIKSHVNRLRGDFQANVSKVSQFNETQFQEAIVAASQISSTQFALSADDEITSSVASKVCFEADSNGVSYNAETSGSLSSKQLLSSRSPPKTSRRSSSGKEIVKYFNQYDNERSARSGVNNESMSESSLNYSNVGLYEKLIQNETNKSQHLTALLKMREKALLDRTKGQMALLEVQKARYKAKGLINHIAAIKKKQRGILLKMEKEREEIKRLLYTTTTDCKSVAAQIVQTGGHKTNSHQSSPAKPRKEKLPASTPPITKPTALGKHLNVKSRNAQSSSPILRATYELKSSRAVEELLKKREEDLRRRREHVEHLIQWHQRLDVEEAQLLSLERQLLSYNNVPQRLEQQQSKFPIATTSASKEKLTSALGTSREQTHTVPAIKTPEKRRASRARKMEKRLKEIDNSLKELSHISASSTTSGVMGQTHNDKEDSISSAATTEIDFVRTTGLKLNKLWKRLTSQQIEKFEPTRRYKLCKSDLEHLYEEAKMAVLRDFAEDEDRIAKELFEKSASNLSSTTAAAIHIDLPAITGDGKIIEVPMLNLNFSSAHSEAEEESANNSQHNTTQQGNYSPSIAEQNFKVQVHLNSSDSSETASETQIPPEAKQSSRLENNVQKFLAFSQRMQRIQTSNARHVAAGRRLQRSLSDTEISDVPKYKAHKTSASQKHIETIASHSNSSITTNSSVRSFSGSAQHQRSKSSIVETTYIPSTATQTNPTGTRQISTRHHIDKLQGNEKKETQKHLTKANEQSNHQVTTRSSVIYSVGTPSSIELHHNQPTSSDIATITEDSKSMPAVSTASQTLKQKSTYSGQVGTNSETTAKEISCKLDEISAAVTQLSQMNALPSYESVATHSHTKHKAIDEPILNATNESNLSTDASSYSLNFENITTDKHSSPGTSSPNTHSSQQLDTLLSKSYTNEDSEHHSESAESPSATSLQTIAPDASISLNATKSKTFVKEGGNTSSQSLTQSMLENHILDNYEADFESDLSNVTHIEDITIPAFETTAETTIQDEDGDGDGEGDDDDDVKLSSKPSSIVENAFKDQEEGITTKVFDQTYNAEELSKSLSSPDDNEKYASKTDFKSVANSPVRELLLPPPPTSCSSTVNMPATTSVASIATTSNQAGGSNHLMPDIINELELRRHQLILDNEHLKQYEHVTAVPYMYVREIPNKPPPPYVPPAHGSPMTAIFPSEDRIKDITYRRTHELYCELLKTEYCNEKGDKLASVMEEQITNIYERIILDICREYLEEHGEILRDGDPTNFHSQLAFFNPPNRLRCIQHAIYKEVRTCLAMDKTQPKRTQIYSVYGQRAKQDHIGKIIIQEMYDEDDRWCNFHREESEVLHLMVQEMIYKNVSTLAREVLLEEGGTIDENEEQQLVEEDSSMGEENLNNHQVEETSQFGKCIDEGKRQQQSQLDTSSLLVETISEDNLTYCVNEDKQELTTLNETSKIERDHQEGISNTNITSPANSVQTCT